MNRPAAARTGKERTQRKVGKENCINIFNIFSFFKKKVLVEGTFAVLGLLTGWQSIDLLEHTMFGFNLIS